jgi:excisionase family DNA binding protein
VRSKQTIKKICEYCGNEFDAGKSTVRYCSHKCNSKAYKEAKRKEVVQLTEELTKQKRVERIKIDISSKEYLSISEAAELVGVSRWTIYRYVVGGKIPSKQFSKRTTRIRKADIELFFDKAEAYQINHISKEQQSITDWYSLNEITEKYGILKDQIRKIVNAENISEMKNGTRTLIAKHQIDNYFKKKGFDSLIVNLAEWYTVGEITDKYKMTEHAIYSFVSKYKIPKKQQGGKRYYSKIHFDTIKNKG